MTSDCTELIPPDHRSLTNQQREILQRYADDIEGRGHMSSKYGTPQDPTEGPKGMDTENGTTSFPRPSAKGGWTGTLRRLRKLIGI